MKVGVVYDSERANGSKDEMDAMHLDTFWMPIEKGGCVACPEEVQRRRYAEIQLRDGELVVVDNSRSFFEDHLSKKGVEMLPISKDVQENHGANFQNLAPGELALTLPAGSDLEKALSERGISVTSADLENITGGAGGLHCMTAAVSRG
jgi:arginine deiminase